ncbi:MAG: haloacid dehalogenase-like hydrolase [Bacteroidales bacterium]|nr:haloacid dehalogenase-like hydrolase [Bacteroidales bacterium]
MPTKKPVVALIYDFDGTLSPLNMQEYDFLKAIGIKDRRKFWDENQKLINTHNASNVLSYMRLMLKKSQAANVSIRREQFVEFGKSIELYKGVEQWFGLVNALGDKYNIKIEHYINSSGLKEMIEGTSIAKNFKEIYACSFMYEDGVAVWPAVAVDFTAKTQFLFMINKGIAKVSENYKVNRYVADKDRPVPFRHMIYFGDGETDVPCMRLVKHKGGNSIAVYRQRNTAKRQLAEQLVAEDRVNFACAADYTAEGEIYRIVESIIRQIRSNLDFENLQRQNKKRFEKK